MFVNINVLYNTIPFSILTDIVHIDTLGPITERLIDFVPSQNGLTVQRRMNNK